MLLWFLIALLLFVVLGVLLWPLLRADTEDTSRSSYDVSVYTDQLKELDRDIERGVVSEQEGESARLEIKRRLLASAAQAEKETAEKGSGGSNLQVVTARVISVCLVVVTAVVLYPLFGSPNYQHVANLEAERVSHVNKLVARVEKRLKENPNEGRGWEVLAPVYMKMGRYSDAAIAYGQSIKLLGESAERWSGYGEAHVRRNNGVLNDDARRAFQRALKIDPGLLLPAMRLIIGLEQEGKTAEALVEWKKLLPKVQDNPALLQMTRMRISELSGSSPESLTGKKTAQGDESGPTAEQVEDARKMNPRDRMAMIQNMVQGLAQRLKEDGGSLEEWTRLIRSYSVLGRKELAQKALEDARKNLKNDEQSLTKLNELATKMGLSS